MAGRADLAARRKSKRKGRETGCWVYIPGEQLDRCELDTKSAPPLYRAWDGRKGTILIQLYERVDVVPAGQVTSG